jgi:hypothetical protein
VTGSGPPDLPPTGPSTGPAGTPPVTNRKAVVSVVYGVCAFAVIYVVPIGGLVLGVPAITSGVHARREIAEARGAECGDMLAFCGLTIGAGAIVTVVLSWLVPLL